MTTLLEENTAILQDLAADGFDLTRPAAVEFTHVFSNEANAEAFLQAIEAEDFEADILEPEDEGEPWDVAITLEIVPTAETITELEQRFTTLARQHSGEPSGWGLYEEE